MERINTPTAQNAVLQLKDVSVSYSPGKYAVKKVNADIFPHTITAIMGPSGCGKSTLLRAINRMHGLYANIQTTGEIILKGKNVLAMDPMVVRRMAGMVFQQPNPFPTMSIYDNVLAGYTLNGIRLNRNEKDEIVEQSLKSVSLWEEVKDVMNKRGSFLSGGQQQRLCIAANGRAHFGTRPHLYEQNRGVVVGTKATVYHHHCHPQHVAGCSYIRQFHVHVPGRIGRAWQHHPNVHQTETQTNRGVSNGGIWMISLFQSIAQWIN
jgi:ABC-type lipoprotein export system ATPase subunit